METLVVDAPFNSLSFGNVSFNILRELYRAKVDVALYPISDNVDLSVFNVDPEFHGWMKDAVNNRHRKLKQDTPTLKLWHIKGSEQFVGKRSFLFTFHETSYGTEYEKRLLNLHEHVFFSSKYSQETFKDIETNSSVLNLGLDEDFTPNNKTYYGDDTIHFGLTGKFENRKHTARILSLWASKFGNQKEYKLTTLVFNKFLSQEDNQKFLQIALKGTRYWNIQNIQFLGTNAEMNDFINSIDCELSGLSGGEGWNLPAFNATALGKWCPVYNHTAHKEWATGANSVLLEPTQRMPSHDGIFFMSGLDFNQGDFYDFDEDQVSEALDKIVKVAKTKNTEGEKLGKKFTYKKTVDQILNTIF